MKIVTAALGCLLVVAAEAQSRISMIHSIASIKPTRVGYTNRPFYAHEGIISYARENIRNWEFVNNMTFPLYIGKKVASYKKETPDHSLATYVRRMQGVKQTTPSELLEAFRDSPVQQVIFEKGSNGCFHHGSVQRVFVLENDQYVFDEIVSNFNSQGTILEGPGKSFDASLVTDLMNDMPAMLSTPITIADIDFTEADYSQCRQDIRELRSLLMEGKEKEKKDFFLLNGKNINFNALLSLVDSVKNISSTSLTESIIQTNSFYSTNENWCGMIFVNAKGQKLYIQHHYKTDSPLLYNLPLTVTINGHATATNNIGFVKFMQQVFPGFVETGKRQLINHLVEKLYLEKSR